MQDRNVIAGSTAAVISPLITFYQNLLPYLLLAIVLIAVYSRFGILASRKRKETIRTSRAIRRAINKLVDYICWITLAGMIGQTFGDSFHIPLMSVIVLCIVYGIELTSIFNNYFEYKGIKMKFNGLKFFSKITGQSAIEESIEEVKDKEQQS
jgi:phosphate starvation-inducible membrane PsiE